MNKTVTDTTTTTEEFNLAVHNDPVYGEERQGVIS